MPERVVPLPSLTFAPPQLQAIWLSPFAAGDWEATFRAFDSASCCTLRQAWNSVAQSEFQETRVSVGVGKDEGGLKTLWVYAQMHDLDIFNFARSRNQRTWEMGDVFEIFLAPQQGNAYFEFHVTPENWTLECEIPLPHSNREQFCLIEYSILRSWTKVDRARGQWDVLAAIPLEKNVVPNVQNWRFSFSRYDATRGYEPILSSSSPHRVLDFHRIEEWGELVLPT